MLKSDILSVIINLEKPQRKALSLRYPFLQRPILFLKIGITNLKKLSFVIARKKSSTFFNYIIARHQSILRRRLGDSHPALQESKITNIKRACTALNGLVIEPGEVFSLWDAIGKPTYKRGYVDGMLLSNGNVMKGVGGGLCQLSNFLCWILLHANMQIIERFHHSMDVFPDSGRVLPFGSGATCLYNFIDLKFKNIGQTPIQIKIWVTPTHLKGQLLSNQKSPVTFSIKETFHTFAKYHATYFRVNELWRMGLKNGEQVSFEKLFSNIAPVLYEVSPEYLSKNNYSLIDFDKISK